MHARMHARQATLRQREREDSNIYIYRCFKNTHVRARQVWTYNWQEEPVFCSGLMMCCVVDQYTIYAASSYMGVLSYVLGMKVALVVAWDRKTNRYQPVCTEPQKKAH